MGLDPGIDHMSAMKLIDDVRAQGGKLTSFISWCGGLPAPECSDVPLGYKFSWSPRGVLTAALNSAIFKLNGEQYEVDGSRLLQSTFKDVPIYPGFALEGLPNRNSLSYVDEYKLGSLDNLDTMFRGTLRYKVCHSWLVFHEILLGILNFDVSACSAWILGSQNGKNIVYFLE